MKYSLQKLDNGIRTVFRHTDSGVAHIGLIVGVGSRDEEKDENGLAHFIEHTIFKGTNRRKAYQVLSHLEHIGGEINAFTSREETCLHASVPAKYIGRAMELLADVYGNSIFPEKELRREKDVVIDEIFYYLDLPDETIMDDFEMLVFRNHPIGRHILGTPDHIRSFDRSRIRNFIRQNYCNEKTVISCVGDIEHDAWLKLADKYFSGLRYKSHEKRRKPFRAYQSFTREEVKKTHQTHCVMGTPAYSFHEASRPGLILLNNVLGGPCNNSRLNMVIREKYGLSYNVESVYTPYTDTGIFVIYMGVENGSALRALALVKKELAHFRDAPLGNLHLQRAKRQIIGQIAMARESNLAEMLSMGKSVLMQDKVDPPEEINRRIIDVTAEKLQEIACEIFDEKRISTLIYTSDSHK